MCRKTGSTGLPNQGRGRPSIQKEATPTSPLPESAPARPFALLSLRSASLRSARIAEGPASAPCPGSTGLTNCGHPRGFNCLRQAVDTNLFLRCGMTQEEAANYTGHTVEVSRGYYTGRPRDVSRENMAKLHALYNGS